MLRVKGEVEKLLAEPGAFPPEQMADARAHIRLQPGFSRLVKDLMRQLQEAAWAEASMLHGEELNERLSDEEVVAWLAIEQEQAQRPEQQRQEEPFITPQVILAGAAAVALMAAAAITINACSARRS